VALRDQNLNDFVLAVRVIVVGAALNGEGLGGLLVQDVGEFVASSWRPLAVVGWYWPSSKTMWLPRVNASAEMAHLR
jgi:hypothetical protein